MRLLKVTCSIFLPYALTLCLGVATLGAPQPRQQDEKKNENRPNENRSRQESRPQPQQQPKPQEQPRQHETRPPQEQPRPEAQPKPETRQQPPQRPQEQPHQQQNARQPEARPQEQRQPNENRQAPVNARQQEQQRGLENRGSGRPEVARQGHTEPTAQDRQRAQGFQSARRVPQSDEQRIFQERRAHDWNHDHRDWRERGGYRGFLIPDDRFRVSFGRPHPFRIYSLPIVYVGGYPEFYYQGFWFEILDPIPPFFAPDWLQTDNVYIDSNDGYYLYDTRYPDVGLAVEPISG